MKAAVLREGNKNLVIEDIPIPEPGAGEVLVKVAACGVCQTDLHYIDHGIPTQKKPPMILGHEISGIVTATGQRVLLLPIFCDNRIMLGNTIDGGFAEYVKVPEEAVIPLPDEIPLEEGCIIADAVSTPYHAVMNRAKVKPTDKVIVFGCGGVGMNVVQISAMLGAEVTACDIDENKLEIAKELGAAYTVKPDQINTKYDVAFEVIGKPETIEAAFKTLGKAGRLCVIGYTNQNITINPAKIMFFEQEIIGSIGCRIGDYSKIFKLVIDGKIKLDKLIANKYRLEGINKALDELRKSKVLRNIILLS
ncbi:MAG: hypothetical protein A2Y25_10975 [Candidatus Melainabacteria bacterium GWF2_37_15]|nr:MAG: hypothetical protein A2Y25_10975 [Candidatus Melainabacteria bacterium GWF2_37_15]